MDRRKEEKEMGFKAETGVVYMLNKKERILLRTLLSVTLQSKAGRQVIGQKHGKASLQIAQSLLREMGGGPSA